MSRDATSPKQSPHTKEHAMSNYRLMAVAVAGVTVLGLAAWPAGPAGATSSTLTPAASTRPAAPAGLDAEDAPPVIYQQIDHPDNVFVLSTRFTDPASKPANSTGADDFTVPAGHTWTVSEIDAIGTYYGSGPASKVTVSVYRDNGGLPGELVARLRRAAFGPGTLVIRLGSDAPILTAGTYFLAVQATMTDVSSWWGWNTRTRKAGYPAVWRNPGDGAGGTGCTAWTNMRRCINYPGDPIPAGPDFEFQLRGADQSR
jgi:hypothetical protein